MQEINAIDFVVIVGPAGSGKSQLIKDCLESALKDNSDVSVYDCLGTYTDIQGKFKYYNFPSAMNHGEEHLNDFKKQIVLDLRADKVIFIDEPQVLMQPGATGSDVFHLSSQSKVFLTTQNLNELKLNFPFLMNRELSIIEVRHERNDVTLINKITNLLKNRKAWISKDTLINNVISQLGVNKS